MKKKIIASILLIALPLALLAQTPKKLGHKAKRLTPSQVEIKSKADQMAAGIRAAEFALSPAELAIAALIYQGNIPCELGASVSVTADAKAPGYFDLQTKKLKYRMSPVVTSTGAIRLEDRQAGAVWLQLANKSMLMNQKLGQRLADVCMNPEQFIVAERLIKTPPPSLLDAPIIVVLDSKPPVAASVAVPSLPDATIPVAPYPTASASGSVAVPSLPAAPIAPDLNLTAPVAAPDPASSQPAASPGVTTK